MRRDEFEVVYQELCNAYGQRMPYKNAVLATWYKILKDLPVDLLQAATLEYMGSPSAFPPTPGQIRGKAIELQKRANKVPSASEAWSMLLNAPVSGVKSWSEKQEDGWHIFNEKYRFDFPIVEKVARDLGWPEKFWTDNLVSDRARFMNAYDHELDSATVEATSIPQVAEYIERTGKTDIKKISAGFRSEALERGE